MSRTKGREMARVSSVYKNRRYFARKRGELPEIDYRPLSEALEEARI